MISGKYKYSQSRVDLRNSVLEAVNRVFVCVEAVCLVASYEELGEVPLRNCVLVLLRGGKPLVHWMAVISFDVQFAKDDALETIGVCELDNFVFRIGFLTAELVAWGQNDVGRWVRVLQFYKRFVGGRSQASLRCDIDDKSCSLFVT